MYFKICCKTHRTGQGRVLRASVSEIVFNYFTRIIYAISYIEFKSHHPSLLKKLPV